MGSKDEFVEGVSVKDPVDLENVVGCCALLAGVAATGVSRVAGRHDADGIEPGDAAGVAEQGRRDRRPEPRAAHRAAATPPGGREHREATRRRAATAQVEGH